MIKRETMWAVTSDLEIKEKTVILEDGKILAAKDIDANNTEYDGNEFEVKSYHKTKNDAAEWIEKVKKETLEQVPIVKRFIVRMDIWWQLAGKLGIKKEDYLGKYAQRTNSYEFLYDMEHYYAEKLETYIKNRMLDIGGHMIPVDQIKDIEWYGIKNAQENEEEEWKAVIHTKDGIKVATHSAGDVRLIWTTIGKVSGTWFIDDDINYEDEE